MGYVLVRDVGWSGVFRLVWGMCCIGMWVGVGYLFRLVWVCVGLGCGLE